MYSGRLLNITEKCALSMNCKNSGSIFFQNTDKFVPDSMASQKTVIITVPTVCVCFLCCFHIWGHYSLYFSVHL